MMILADTYLGNQDSDLALHDRVEHARHTATLFEVYLQTDDRAKGRIHAHTTTGEAIGIIKSREHLLQTGDVFATGQGHLLLIHLDAQAVMVLRFTKQAAGHEIALIHLGHVLGNHHWSILVQGDRIYVEMAADPSVMEATIKAFNIPGLSIQYELKSCGTTLNFSHHTHH